MVETKKTTTGESRHQYCYSCVIKYPDQNDRSAAVINRIDDQIAEKDRQIKALDRQQVCLSFAWVAWAILIAYLLFTGCSPSTSSPTAPEPGTEEPTPPPPPPPPPAPDLFNITLLGMDDLTYRGSAMDKEAIRRAVRHWESVITEGLPDVTIPQRALQVLPPSWGIYVGDLKVDDIVIHIAYRAEGNGNENALASAAGWVIPQLRGDPALPVMGSVDFYPGLLEKGNMAELVMIFVHEIGHALGFEETILRDGGGIETINGAPYFSGPNAAVAYENLLGRVGQRPAMAFVVPIQGDGSLSHWKDPELAWDVMNRYAGSTSVLSLVTLGAMADLGYKIDFSQAQEPRIPPATKLTAVAPHAFCGGGQIHIITP